MRMFCTCATVFSLVKVAMNFRAAACVKISHASCTHGTNKSTMSALASRFNKQRSTMSRSLITPNARMTMKSGIGFRTLGMSTTICLLLYLASGATSLTAILRSGLEGSSDTVRTSALQL